MPARRCWCWRISARPMGGAAVRAVRGVSLAVGSGEVYGFLGPNGAGKSTTIRMLIGLIAPSAGRVSLFGRDLAAEPSLLKRVGSLVGRSEERTSEVQSRGLVSCA